MRTTIRLPDEVLRRAKARAAERGQSLTAYIERVVRNSLDEPTPPAAADPSIPVSTRLGWLQPGVTLEKVQDLFDAEDLAEGKFR